MYICMLGTYVHVCRAERVARSLGAGRDTANVWMMGVWVADGGIDATFLAGTGLHNLHNLTYQQPTSTYSTYSTYKQLTSSLRPSSTKGWILNWSSTKAYSLPYILRDVFYLPRVLYFLVSFVSLHTYVQRPYLHIVCGIGCLIYDH